MGQCFSVLSRWRCRNKVRPLEVKNDGRKDGKKEIWNVEKKEKGEETKLEAQENDLDENVYQNNDKVNSVLKDSEGFDRVQNETNVHEEMNEDKNETEDRNNVVKITKDGSLSAFSGESSTNICIIAVQPVEEKSFPVQCRDDISNSTGKELVNPASMLIPQNAKRMPCLCINYEQDTKTQKKEDKERNKERSQVEKREWKHIPKSESLNRMNEYQQIDSQDKIFGKDKTSLSIDEKIMRITHLSVRNQLLEDVVEPVLPERDFWLPDDTKETMVTTKKVTHKQSAERYRDNLHGEKLHSSYEWNTQAPQNDKAVADKIIGKGKNETTAEMFPGQTKTSTTSNNSYKSEPSKGFSTNSSSSEEPKTNEPHGDNQPYWALPGNVVSTCWNKQRLTYKPDNSNVETVMRNIDSEMAALLKPDEKTPSITFTICEKTRAKTLRKTRLKRLEQKQRNEVDQEKVNEKQKNAERRNESIAKRIQSARRRSKRKEISNGKQHDKIIERIEAAIGRKEEIVEQRVRVAQKSSQIKTDVVKSREIETTNVKKKVLEKIGAATVRREDVIDQKVQVAIKYSKLRRNTDKQVERTKEHVFEKIEEATVRRNEFLKKRVNKSSVSNRGDVVKEKQEKLAEIQQTDLIRKLKISQENRERMLRQTVRRQVILEKRRELARRRLARIKQEQDEGHLRFVELETYNYDESDESENVWE